MHCRDASHPFSNTKFTMFTITFCHIYPLLLLIFFFKFCFYIYSYKKPSYARRVKNDRKFEKLVDLDEHLTHNNACIVWWMLPLSLHLLHDQSEYSPSRRTSAASVKLEAHLLPLKPASENRHKCNVKPSSNSQSDSALQPISGVFPT